MSLFEDLLIPKINDNLKIMDDRLVNFNFKNLLLTIEHNLNDLYQSITDFNFTPEVLINPEDKNPNKSNSTSYECDINDIKHENNNYNENFQNNVIGAKQQTIFPDKASVFLLIINFFNGID